MAGSQQSRPPRGAAVPYLAVRGAREAVDWYGTVFGAVVDGEPFENDDGTIGHVALRVADGVFYLADEAPAYDAVAPTGPGAAVSLVLPVPDVEATFTDRRAGGGDTRPPWRPREQRRARRVVHRPVRPPVGRPQPAVGLRPAPGPGRGRPGCSP